MKFLLVLFLIFVSFVALHALEPRIVRARLESCPSCKLNRLPEVRAFVYEDIPKYDNTEFKKIHGASPILLFLDENDDVIEKHSLENLNRKECNNLLLDRGFKVKDKEL